MKSSIVYIDDLEQARKEILKIGSWGKAIDIMAPKAMNVCIKLYDVGAWEANIIKQEMLSKGGEVAVHKEVCRLAIKRSDILIMGNIAQYNRLIKKLLIQPGELKNIATELNYIIQIIKAPKSTHVLCGNYTIPVGNKTVNICSKPISQLLVKTNDIGQAYFDMLQIDCIQSNEAKVADVLPQLIRSLKNQFDKPILIKTSCIRLLKIAINSGINCIHATGVDVPPSMFDDIVKHNLGIIVSYSQNAETNVTPDERLIELRRKVEYINSNGIKNECIIVYPFDDIMDTFDLHISTLMNMKKFRTLGSPILYYINCEIIKQMGEKYEVDFDKAELLCNALAIGHGADLIVKSNVNNNILNMIDELLVRSS